MNTATTAAANILPLTARSDAPAWRILLLLNCFRVLIPMVLGSLFLTLQPAPVGSQQPLLFVFVLSSYEFFALLTFISIKRHWPEIQIQALTQVLTDIIAVSLLTYSSGGIDSGLGALLILPVAAASLIIKP
ncbi:MAG: hypothetical protein AB7U99_11525, partial [Steroidobacteraceae bacterium]